MFQPRLAALTAMIAAIVSIAGAQNASAQDWCSPCQGSYSPTYSNYSTMVVRHGTYYRPLDGVRRGCGWHFVDADCEVRHGSYLGGCEVRTTGTGRIVRYRGWLHIFQAPLDIQPQRCAPSVVYSPPPCSSQRKTCASPETIAAKRSLPTSVASKGKDEVALDDDI